MMTCPHTKQIRRFSAYEEYAARSDRIHGDVDFAQRTLLQSHDYDKAIETLYASINSARDLAVQHRRALGLKDLLIKVSTAMLIRVRWTNKLLITSSLFNA